MKRRLYILLALVLILALCFGTMLMACDKKDRDDDEEEEEVSKDIYNGQSRTSKETMMNYLQKAISSKNYTIPYTREHVACEYKVAKNVICETMRADGRMKFSQIQPYTDPTMSAVIFGIDGKYKYSALAETVDKYILSGITQLEQVVTPIIEHATYDKEIKKFRSYVTYGPMDYPCFMELKDDGLYITDVGLVVSDMALKDIGKTSIKMFDLDSLEEDKGPEILPPVTTTTFNDTFKEHMIDRTTNNVIYYVGSKNVLDLKRAFPEYDSFTDRNDIVIGSIGVGGMDIVNINAFKGRDVTRIELHVVDAVNVYGDGEVTLIEELGKGNSVVMHEDITTAGNSTIKMMDGAKLYGNMHAIYGDSISAPRDNSKNDKTSWGSHLVEMEGGTAINGVNLYVNTVQDNEKCMLEDFEFSGSGIKVSANLDNKDYKTTYITNCIVQNGQKLLDIEGANVYVKGSLFANSADASIASSTSRKKGSNITLENVVTSNSMVAGFLFYGWEELPAGDVEHQQTLTIKGFFDIYNWKVADATFKVVPATEGTNIKIDEIINANLNKELSSSQFDYLMYKQNDKKYIHMGIVRLATGGCRTQDPAIYYIDTNGNKLGGKRGNVSGAYPQYAEKNFPLPGWVKNLGIVKTLDVINYKNQSNFASGETPYIMPDSVITGDIINDLRYGRA